MTYKTTAEKLILIYVWSMWHDKFRFIRSCSFVTQEQSAQNRFNVWFLCYDNVKFHFVLRTKCSSPPIFCIPFLLISLPNHLSQSLLLLWTFSIWGINKGPRGSWPLLISAICIFHSTDKKSNKMWVSRWQHQICNLVLWWRFLPVSSQLDFAIYRSSSTSEDMV